MKILVFLGSVRDSAPPRPARLGLRVARACMRELESRGVDVELIDPLDLERDRVFKPHFAYRKGAAPPQLEELSNKIGKADGYVMISPEYNHSMSPALADMLNLFGASLFAFKPSAIVTYSAGQWGGTRAAVTMRSFLSELGCLPVSAMVHIPHAGQVFDDDGSYALSADEARWSGYLGRTFSQLEWWAQAAANQRGVSSPTRPFLRDPSQRNAP